MEFLEGGIYRPVRVLFDTPIYDRALQICWHIRSYKSQIALMTELLRLQQNKVIPSQVSTEDMINLILEESKSTLRERLWEFELEGFDEEEAKPLLMLAWAVNVSNKMRDVEFEAQMLLNSPQALPPNFQHPKVLSVAQDYAKILREKKEEAPSFKLLCPQEVVMEVVPKVLQGLWVLPPNTLLNMPSLKLSKLSIGVTKAVLDGVSNGLPNKEHQAIFSRAIRDDMVLSILTEIGQTYPHDVLVNRIVNFAPVLLTSIADVAVGQICGMFLPQNHKVSVHLTPTEPPATKPDCSLPVTEEKLISSSETNSAVVRAASLISSAKTASISEVQAEDSDSETSRLVTNPNIDAVDLTSNKLPMEFLEGSRGIYTPIRELFFRPIYNRTLQLCWNINSYKSKIALMIELLKLQQKNVIPSQVSTEDMINLILEKSKPTLRKSLWEIELEGFDEEEAKPLLMLAWAVNVSNKMRDVEFKAKMFLNSPQALPPDFQHPKVLSVAQDYAKILREKKEEAPSFKLLCPQEVVMEVVPKVLQGFWVLSPNTILNMPSLKLSKLSIGVTKAVLDGVSNGLPNKEHQAIFSRAIRDDMVLSILTEIRQMYPHDVLVSRIKSFAPVLLSSIVEVAVGQICGMFLPQNHKVSVHLTPTEPPATKPDCSLPVTKEKLISSSETNPAVVRAASLISSAKPASIPDVLVQENDNKEPRLMMDPKNITVSDSAVVPAPPTPPAKPASIPEVQTKDTDNKKSKPVKEPKNITVPDSAVVPATPTPPAKPASTPEVQVREHHNEIPRPMKDPKPTKEPDSAVVPATPTPPAKPATITKVQASDNDKLKLVKEPKPSRNKVQRFFHWLLQSMCCCCVASQTDSN